MSFTFTGDLKKLNAHLADKAFIGGFKLSGADMSAVFEVGKLSIPEDCVHVTRWFKHITSYTLSELKRQGGCCCSGTCPKSAAKPVAKEEDEKIEDDLFGSESESEGTKAKKEETRKKIANAKATGGKIKKVDRSMLIIHIKPWEDTTDMAPILESIPKKIQMEGLTWGKGELKDGPYNIKFIAIACVIIDDLCSSDELCEKIIETYTDDVIQNADIIAFNKME